MPACDSELQSFKDLLTRLCAFSKGVVSLFFIGRCSLFCSVNCNTAHAVSRFDSPVAVYAKVKPQND